jgi:hypothetical protein
MITTLILFLIVPIIDYLRLKRKSNKEKPVNINQRIIIISAMILIILSIIEIIIAISISLSIANECCFPPRSIITLDIFKIIVLAGLSFILGLYWGPFYPLGEYILIYLLMIGVIVIYISFYTYLALKTQNKSNKLIHSKERRV